MSITMEQAKNLRIGQTLHPNTAKNADGTCQRWRVHGKVKTWKRNPTRIEVSLKYGLRNYCTINSRELELVHMPGDPQFPCHDHKAEGCRYVGMGMWSCGKCDQKQE
jgi:ribosomal protein L37AE/L43A